MKLTDKELDAILAKAQLKMAEPYHANESYAKNKHILTECLVCGTQAHYTLKYILEKTGKEPVCRREFWLGWQDEASRLQTVQAHNDFMALLKSRFGDSIPDWLAKEPVKPEPDKLDDGVIEPDSSARAFANGHGFDLLHLFSGRVDGSPLYHVKCQKCGRISVMRKGDVAWGCSCKLVAPSNTGKKTVGKKTVNLLCESDEPCVGWWDHLKNNESDFMTVRAKGRGVFWWKCPECGHSFQAPVYRMTHPLMGPQCPECKRKRSEAWDAEVAEYKARYVSEVPELLEAWDDDEYDPSTVHVFTHVQYRFKCPNGHHPRTTPFHYMKNGCPHCAATATRKAQAGAQVYLRHTSPELAQEWDEQRNGKRISPDNVKISSKRNVWWKCLECGHEWQLPVYQRNRNYGQACPSCGKVLNSFAWQYPGIASEWSPNNPVSPWNIYPGATNLPFVPEWVCKNNPEHVWRAGLAGRIQGSECPECRDYGRSRIALQYFEAIKKRYSTARCEVPLFDESFSHQPWSVDILFTTDTKTVVVEYDGEYWHSGKSDTDKRKSVELLGAGYLVIRLREGSLSSLDIKSKEYTEFFVDGQKPNTAYVARLIADWLKSHDAKS